MSTINRQGILIFSAAVSEELEQTYRLPPTSIGVRRIRPSQKVVREALHLRKKQKSDNSKIRESEIVGAGVSTDAQSISPVESRPSRSPFPSSKDTKNEMVEIEESSLKAPLPIESDATTDYATQQRNRYHQLEMNNRLLEEELAELKGENSAILPVFLSPSMARQASCLGLLSDFRKNNNLGKIDNSGLNSSETFKKRIVELNDDLACRWAKLLKQSMKQAEIDRDNEQMRPMAYTLMPEVWTRLKPVVDIIRNHLESQCSNHVIESPKMKTMDSKAKSLLSTEMRPPSSRMNHDKSLEVIFECLHNSFPKLNISCGVKFGCDYLLYDGCRKDRHAFAGLRVCVAKRGDQELPLPTAFDLAGYVRVLNTAGKLALLATIKEVPELKTMKDKNDEYSRFHLAIVDLALEKVLNAPTHQRKPSRYKGVKRKEVGLHLDKRNK